MRPLLRTRTTSAASGCTWKSDGLTSPAGSSRTRVGAAARTKVNSAEASKAEAEGTGLADVAAMLLPRLGDAVGRRRRHRVLDSSCSQHTLADLLTVMMQKVYTNFSFILHGCICYGPATWKGWMMGREEEGMEGGQEERSGVEGRGKVTLHSVALCFCFCLCFMRVLLCVGRVGVSGFSAAWVVRARYSSLRCIPSLRLATFLRVVGSVQVICEAFGI